MNAATNNAAITDVATGSSGLWLSPQVVAALIALGGVILGLVARDIFMAAHLARKKRADEIADRKEAARKAHRDLVRLYADPLKDAVTSLKFRLHEIVEKKQARYLLADAPKIPFLEYKRISTLYRIAAVLGWIRAIRRERSYLDPDQAASSVEMHAIGELEAALADGTHVELQRLEELSALWAVPAIEPARKDHIANLIDGERADFLAKQGALSFRDLAEGDQAKLATRCADIIRREAGVEIDPERIAAASEQASITFGIKEAYIYRDWQAAIGDLMLQDDKGGARHFSVIGFGLFEDMLIAAQRKKGSTAMRWFDRLERLIHDLDMTREDNFDARREQLRKLYRCCEKLETSLAERIATPPAVS
jgi:hypothetical protein